MGCKVCRNNEDVIDHEKNEQKTTELSPIYN